MKSSGEITSRQCTELMEEVVRLRSLNPFYRNKFGQNAIAESTGIPQGSVGRYINHEWIPVYRYSVMKSYVDYVKEQFKLFRNESI